jgi:F-type H+-transporting ATPase subunit alpha
VPDGLGDAVADFKSQFLAASASSRAVDPTATDAGEVGDAHSNKTLATE